MEQQPHNPVPIELENQFLIRLPSGPAESLRDAIRGGDTELKKRFYIQLEPDNPAIGHVRRGKVQVDDALLSAKMVDLPTVMESHKTIDRKTLYKTADICQLLICKEGDPSDDEVNSDEEKKKDQNKVDKKFFYPHGICPPLKNCRKRRFRKILKKKHCLDEPEIEKEVKRLFRTDNEAVDVKWQLLGEEELSASKGGSGAAGPSGEGRSDTNLGDQDLFGDLSDIEDDGPDHDCSDGKINLPSEGDSTTYGDLDTSRNSASSQLVTEFNKDMFKPTARTDSSVTAGTSSSGPMEPPDSRDGEDAVAVRLAKINAEIVELRRRKQETEKNIATCPNPALQQKFRETLQKVDQVLRTREMEADAFSMFSQNE